MSVAGLCEICEADTVVDNCDRCGRVVCEDHHESDTGYCTDCHAEFGGEGGTPDNEDTDYPDGVDEYEF